MTRLKPDPQVAIAQVNAILSRKYIAELEVTRMRLLRTNVTVRTTRRKVTVFDANNHAHFIKMLKVPRTGVHSIWFSESAKALAPPLATKYYNGIVSDCNIDKRNHPYDVKTCFTRPEDVEEPLPLSEAIKAEQRFSHLSVKTKANSTSELRHNFTFVLVIAGAFVTRHGEVIKDDWKIIPRSCHHVEHFQDFKPTYGYKRYREVFVLSQYGGTEFYHFVLENLTRIAAYLSFVMRHPNIKILVRQQTRYTKQFLAGIGIDQSRLIYGEIQADIVYMPAGTPCVRATLFNSQFLSMQLRAGMSEPAPQRDTIILIRRSKKRWFDHHDDILAMLRRRADSVGLKTVVYGDNPVPGFHETRQLFSRAYLVVAPHGAGESNLIFSQPGTILVEGMCYDRTGHPKWCYRHLMIMLGHRYWGILLEKPCMNITAADIEPAAKYYVDKLK